MRICSNAIHSESTGGSMLIANLRSSTMGRDCITLPCANIVDFVPFPVCNGRDSNSRLLDNRPSTLAVVCPSQTASRQSQSTQTFRHKMQKNMPFPLRSSTNENQVSKCENPFPECEIQFSKCELQFSMWTSIFQMRNLIFQVWKSCFRSWK